MQNEERISRNMMQGEILRDNSYKGFFLIGLDNSAKKTDPNPNIINTHI